MESGRDFVPLLRRWENAGGVWKVLSRDHDAVIIGLYRCDGGEEVDRFEAAAPRVSEFLAGRASSQDRLG